MATWVLGGLAAAGIYATWPNPMQPFRPYVEQDPASFAEYPKGRRLWTTRPDEPVEFDFAKTGVASKDYGNVVSAFRRAVEKMGDKPALKIEARGYPADRAGEWESYTWTEYYTACENFAKSLIALKFKTFSGVTICGFNHPGWFIAHMGCMMAQGLSAGCYTTNTPELCFYVADHSESEVVVVDTVKNLDKFLENKSKLSRVKAFVVYQEEIPDSYKSKYGDLVMTLNDFLLAGADVKKAEVDARIAKINSRHACTLIYTSGTTGNPKACMISHDSMLFIGMSALESTEMYDGSDHHIISYLPMSHIAAQVCDIGFPILFASEFGCNATAWFGRPDALKGSLPVTLKAVQPTIFFGVPRVWEKFVEGIKAKAKAAPATGLKLQLVNFAKRVGLESNVNRQVGGNGHVPRGYNVANKLVFSKVREALGLTRCKWHLTGAAPIQRETLDFLAALGIDVLELYGMSETCGPATMSTPFRFKFGSCGFRLNACELKIDHQAGRDKPGEGEICFRGRHIMMGYLRNAEKTREAIDADGWLHSGDVGAFDEHGMLRITGRIKELIIGAGGENIAPVPIEDEIKRICPALSNAVMIGDKRKYNVMLVTVKSKQDLETGEFTQELVNEALDVNRDVRTVAEAIKDPKWKAYVEAGIKKYNNSPACPSNAQKIQKFAFLPTDLSIPGGELTGTMKVKRQTVTEKYSEIIEKLYEGSD